MHLPSHLVHISNVRSVVRVRVDTHTDQFPKLQGKTVLLALKCSSTFTYTHMFCHTVSQMVLLSPFK